MKAWSRLLIATAVVGISTVAVYEARLAARYRRTIAAQTNAAARLESRIQESLARAAGTSEIAQNLRAASPESLVPINAADPVEPEEVTQWLRKVRQLQQAFAERPDQYIPVLDLLNAQDWAAAAREAKLETDEGIERSLAQTRTKAKSRFTSLMFAALESYLGDNKGKLPTKLIELLPYLDNSAQDPAMLERYELTASGKLRDLPVDDMLIKEKEIVNEQLENRIEIIHAGNGKPTFMNSLPHRDSIDLSEEFDLYFLHAARAFVAANQGAMPTSPEQLVPYFQPALGRLAKGTTFHPTPPGEETAYQKIIENLLRKSIESSTSLESPAAP